MWARGWHGRRRVPELDRSGVPDRRISADVDTPPSIAPAPRGTLPRSFTQSERRRPTHIRFPAVLRRDVGRPTGGHSLRAGTGRPSRNARRRCSGCVRIIRIGVARRPGRDRPICGSRGLACNRSGRIHYRRIYVTLVSFAHTQFLSPIFREYTIELVYRQIFGYYSGNRSEGPLPGRRSIRLIRIPYNSTGRSRYDGRGVLLRRSME